MKRRFNSLTTGAFGHTNEKGRKQIALRMVPAMFEELKARAIKNKVSLSAQMTDYIELGLQVDRDCDEDVTLMPSN